MRVPEGFQRLDQAGSIVVAKTELAGLPIAAFFAAGAPLEGAAGRGAVAVLTLADLEVVVRTYRRGGALRKVLPDCFRSPDRAVQELEVLSRLREADVPVVEPIAAMARRCGLMFELRIATRRVVGARTLPGFVARHPELHRTAVELAGRAVAAAFDAGLRHPDLHPDNVLAWRAADRVCQVALLDFDRATLSDGPTPQAARDAMLVRMARYLRKHAKRLPIRTSGVDQLRFLRGLGLDRQQRRATVERLQPLLLAQLRRRGLDGRPIRPGRIGR